MKKSKKENIKKGFYFNDYTESEIVDKKKNFKNIKISQNRVTFIFFIFISLITIFGIKITYLSLFPEKSSYSSDLKKKTINQRRNIIDRNGSILATNVSLYDVGVRPKLLNKKDKKNLLIKLNLLFPEMNLNNVEQKLRGNNFFLDGKKINTQGERSVLVIG